MGENGGRNSKTCTHRLREKGTRSHSQVEELKAVAERVEAKEAATVVARVEARAEVMVVEEMGEAVVKRRARCGWHCYRPRTGQYRHG